MLFSFEIGDGRIHFVSTITTISKRIKKFMLMFRKRMYEKFFISTMFTSIHLLNHV